MALKNRNIIGGPLQAVIDANLEGISITEDGEMWTTVTERENDVFAVYNEVGLAATKYIALIDKDSALWPHRKQSQGFNRIDITSIYYALELSANAGLSILYGVITRVNGTNADISYFTAIPKLTGTNQEDEIVSLRGVPSQIKLDTDNGTFGHGISNIRETNVVAVNTGLKLDSPAGAASVTPDVGDLIVKINVTAGTVTFGTFIFYHGHS